MRSKRWKLTSMRDERQGPGRPLASAVAAILLSVALAAALPLPVSAHSPKVGEKAPDFRLPDTAGKTVSLSQLRAAGPKASWVLLVFYRGYW